MGDGATEKPSHICDLSCPVAHVVRGAPAVGAESTLREAAQAMIADDAAAAVIRGPNGPTDIVTERDLVRALADGADPDAVWVADVASTHVGAVTPASSLSDAVAQMAEEGVRHIPVKVGGDVVGLVGMEDLVEVFNSRLLTLSSS